MDVNKKGNIIPFISNLKINKVFKDENKKEEMSICKGYYCSYFGLPSGQPLDALWMVASHVPEARARSI